MSIRLTYYKSQATAAAYTEYIIQQTSGISNLRNLQVFLTPTGYVHVDATHVPSTYRRIGPYPTRVTPWCTNMLAILHACGFSNVVRIERLRIFNPDDQDNMDTMTECVYTTDSPVWPQTTTPPSATVTPIHDLAKANKTLALGFDAQDLSYYTTLFHTTLQRPPTQLELMDLAQSNSEHSRHWFFRGKLHNKEGNVLLNGKSLFDIIKDTQRTSSRASKSAFCDNSSALEGSTVPYMHVDMYLQYTLKDRLLHPTFTAETHNFPTSVAPFEGAATGVGGRLRDQHAIGRGGLILAGTVGYAIANPFGRDGKLSRAGHILIEGSNGVSDYANKFGEPLINGFCRTYEEYNGRAWHKPILFSGGVGQVFDNHVIKQAPLEGDLVVKLGGPAYRIGVGGGTASSRPHNIANQASDLAAVQRGDAEMENKLNRVIRSCVELGDTNPIRSIHDQGAGGTANVTKEIVHPLGATIHLERVLLGDRSMTPQEVWISEYQEQDTVLIRPEHRNTLKLFCEREDVPMAVIGQAENTGRVQVMHNTTIILDLPLDAVVGDDMPQKRYTVHAPTTATACIPCSNCKLMHTMDAPDERNVRDVVMNYFGTLNVGSKRFLTNKIDRSVGGLVAQQSCVGPFQTPVADFGIVAQSHFGFTGIATANGERPTIGLTHPARMARMAVGEMLTNLMFAGVRALKDVRCAGNWMWPLTGEGKEEERHTLYEACVAMCTTMRALGIALDGGKDSLSMSYTDKDGNTTKAPRQLVISGYAAVPDIRIKVTPDLKAVGNALVYVHLADATHYRAGGSEGCRNLGRHRNPGPEVWGPDCHCEPPDLDEPQRLKHVFNTVQTLLREPNVIVAGHDRSDGGLAVTLCEMAMAGNLGLNVTLPTVNDIGWYQLLVSEELGVVLEVAPQHAERVATLLGGHVIGTVTDERQVSIRVGDALFQSPLHQLRKAWEMTSMRLEGHQSKIGYKEYSHFLWEDHATGHIDVQTLTTVPIPTPLTTTTPSTIPRIAILREQGSNGDREMAAAFIQAGFVAVDISLHDLYGMDDPSLDSFQGIAFVGGFSYADVGGSAFGWQRIIESNPHLRHAFEAFRKRTDTFSLGVCNGCQLMVRLGWVPNASLTSNESGRFESRFVQVRVPQKTNAILFEGMQNASLGVWIAHGEGRFALHDKGTTLPSLTYAQSRYPFNPNGSERDTAALCSTDGRHLAMMPHPERSVLPWQWPLYDKQVPRYRKNYTPWHRLFENAYRWCMQRATRP